MSTYSNNNIQIFVDNLCALKIVDWSMHDEMPGMPKFISIEGVVAE